MSNISKEEVIHLMKIQAQLINESFEALFEVLELTPEQIEKYHIITTEKMYERHDKKNSMSLDGKEPSNNH